MELGGVGEMIVTGLTWQEVARDLGRAFIFTALPVGGAAFVARPWVAANADVKRCNGCPEEKEKD